MIETSKGGVRLQNNLPVILSVILNIVQLVLLVLTVVVYIRTRDRARELDNLGKLRKIAELHKEGILEDEEFKSKKNEILSRV